MENTIKIPDLVSDANNENSKIDKTTQDKIHKHLSDPTDVISEEDIKNVKTDFSDNESQFSGSGEEDQPHEAAKLDGDSSNDTETDRKAHNDKAQITLWNILK